MDKIRVITTMAVLCLGGVISPIWAENGQPGRSEPESNENVLSDGAELLAPIPPIDTYDEIARRPLFHSNRRPKPLENAATGTTDSELKEEWRLTGVILRDPPIALFAPKETGAEPKRVEAGMALVQNWLLDEVGPDYVLLSDGDEQIRFELWQPRALALPVTSRDAQPEIISRPVRPQLVPETTEKTVTPESEQ